MSFVKVSVDSTPTLLLPERVRKKIIITNVPSSADIVWINIDSEAGPEQGFPLYPAETWIDDVYPTSGRIYVYSEGLSTLTIVEE
jgi:hypothetical protein